MDREIRRRRTRRFPYGVVYSLDGEKVVVIAVMHLHRHSDSWRRGSGQSPRRPRRIHTARLAPFAIREWRMAMALKPQDVLVVLKLLASGWPGSFAALAQDIGLSVSETHAAMGRAQLAGLVHATADKRPNRSAIAEFLVHGVRYVFPASPGTSTRGIPTSHAAAPLNAEFPAATEGDIPVWPDPEGEHRGYELKPLCRSVPMAARRDARLYEWLALVDALRGGRARERALAIRLVRERLSHES